MVHFQQTLTPMRLETLVQSQCIISQTTRVLKPLEAKRKDHSRLTTDGHFVAVHLRTEHLWLHEEVTTCEKYSHTLLGGGCF